MRHGGGRDNGGRRRTREGIGAFCGVFRAALIEELKDARCPILSAEASF
jgi:hypothetical protein